MNTVETFVKENLGTVRVVKNESGEWFIAKDVCDILEIGNPRQALSRLDDDERNTVILNDGISPKRGNPTFNVINESGLSQLVLSSRKPQAKEFKRWLTHEVLPAIRKNGGYIDAQEHMPDEERAKLEAEVRALHEVAKDWEYKNKKLQQDVDHLTKIIERDTTGDLERRKRRPVETWDNPNLYDLDVEGYMEFQQDMECFNFSDFSLMQSIRAILKKARKTDYIDKVSYRYLSEEIERLFIERNM